MPRGAELQRVVEQIADGPFEQRHARVDDRGVVDLQSDLAPGAALLARDDALDELAEVDLLLELLAAGVGRELDQLANEVGELAELDVGLAEQLVALGRVEGPGAP